MSTFTAQYPGRCGWCDEWFQPGTPIEFTDAGGVYTHATCADDMPSVRPVETCRNCHLTKPCGCEDD